MFTFEQRSYYAKAATNLRSERQVGADLQVVF